MSEQHPFKIIQEEGFQLFLKKNKDYGDAYKTYGPVGIIVRIGDKVNRLMSVTKNSVAMVDNEKIEDTLIDLQNYCTLALMTLREES